MRKKSFKIMEKDKNKGDNENTKLFKQKQRHALFNNA